MTVHVVADSRTGVLAALAKACREPGGVSHWQAAPRCASVASGDAIVVDLVDLPRGVRCLEVAPLADSAAVFVLSGEGTVDAGWLALIADGAAHLVQCDDGSRRNGYGVVTSALTAFLGGPAPDDLAKCVMGCEPAFKGLGDLVTAVCRDPAHVRKPADLARAARIDLDFVKRLCQAMGYRCVEHFLCAVRLAIHDCLVAHFGLHSSAGWARVGVTDRSNFQRQLARAESGSRTAFDWKRAGLASVAVALAAALCAGCGSGGQEAGAQGLRDSSSADGHADSTLALPVVGALVRRGDLVLSVRATGAVRAERLVTLKVETQGTVAEVLVLPGERVDSGQVLARLDPRPLDLAVREAEGALDEARTRLTDALIGDVADDTSAAARTRREGARMRSGIAGAEARLERARLDRERATIAAPFGGTVDRVGVVAAQRVSVGEEVARLVDLGSLVIEASVLEHDLPYMRAGGQATVVPSASPDTRYRGTIVAVLPVVDTVTRAGRVLVRVRTADGRLRPGMYADVQLEAARLVGRVLVPAGAVIERDGRTLVFRARGGRADWVYVPVGRSNGVETEVLADSVAGRTLVEPGDTVLVGGHLTLTHDAPIRVRVQGAREGP